MVLLGTCHSVHEDNKTTQKIISDMSQCIHVGVHIQCYTYKVNTIGHIPIANILIK